MGTTWSKESNTKASATDVNIDTSIQIDQGQSFLIKNSSSSNIFTVEENTGDITTTGSITTSQASTFSSLLTCTLGIKLGNNIIYASDGGATITLSDSDNAAITGDLIVTGNDI